MTVSGNVSRNPLAMFTADWHVRNRDRVWAGYSDIVGDTSYALQQVFDYVDYFRPACLLLGGDQTQGKLHKSDAIKLLGDTIHAISNLTEILFIQGNHDWDEPNLVNALDHRPVHIHKKLVTVCGAQIYGLDFVPDDVAPAEIQQVPPCEILLTHQKWKEWGGGTYGVVSMDDLPACKLLCNGDYHVRVELQRPKLNAISPGPICIQSTNEDPAKFVYLIYDDLSFEAIPLKCRSISHIDIHSEDKLNDVLSNSQFIENLNRRQPGVPDSVAKQILVVKYLGTIPRLKARLLAAARDNAHLMFNAYLPEPVMQSTGLPVTPNLTLGQAARIKCADQMDLAEAAEQLAEASDPVAAIETMYENWTR